MPTAHWPRARKGQGVCGEGRGAGTQEDPRPASDWLGIFCPAEIRRRGEERRQEGHHGSTVKQQRGGREVKKTATNKASEKEMTRNTMDNGKTSAGCYGPTSMQRKDHAGALRQSYQSQPLLLRLLDARLQFFGEAHIRPLRWTQRGSTGTSWVRKPHCVASTWNHN